MRERFWNLPNTVTMLRLLVVPLLVGFPLYPGTRGSQIVAWLFILAALGDLADGWLARRNRQVTRIGKLLDPLADKLMVSTALIVLLSMDRISIEGLPDVVGIGLVVVIVGRELAVTGLRGIASAGGIAVAASWAGKAKALNQNVAIGFLLFPTGTLGLPNHRLGVVLLGIAAALTLSSGYAYFASYFSRSAEGDAPPER